MKKMLLPVLFVLASFIPAANAAEGTETVCLAPELVMFAGAWQQIVNGDVIAVKVIVATEGGLYMDYVDLADGLVGGKYSALTIQEDGTFLTYEDYDSHVTRHTLTIKDLNTIHGQQYGFDRGGAISEYIMKRIEE